MTISEAIMQAKRLRETTETEERLADLLTRLDGQISEFMGVDPPRYSYPSEDKLLADDEYAELYVYYLCAQIDFYNQETELYANDSAAFENEMNAFRAFYRRKNRPCKRKNWRVW